MVQDVKISLVPETLLSTMEKTTIISLRSFGTVEFWGCGRILRDAGPTNWLFPRHFLMNITSCKYN